MASLWGRDSVSCRPSYSAFSGSTGPRTSYPEMADGWAGGGVTSLEGPRAGGGLSQPSGVQDVPPSQRPLAFSPTGMSMLRFSGNCTSLPLLPLAQPPLPLSQVFTPSRHQTALVQVTNHPAALGPTLASCTHGPSRLFKASFSWLLVTSSLCTAPSPPLPDPPPRLRPPPCISLSVLLVLLRSLRDLQSPYF